jgi:hypothetical protein
MFSAKKLDRKNEIWGKYHEIVCGLIYEKGRRELHIECERIKVTR